MQRIRYIPFKNFSAPYQLVSRKFWFRFVVMEGVHLIDFLKQNNFSKTKQCETKAGS